MKLLDYQLQSTVARLLARENITVIHANVPTACFDIKNRIMKLPIWKDHGKVVYDMLIAHEVGHAIFDDYDLLNEYLDTNKFSSIPDALNVIDDIRIERKVQDKYPGLPKIFNAAYNSLFESDLFGVKDTDVSTLPFVDRLNLHAKLGHRLDVPFSDEELEFYKRCYAADTTQDMLDLFEELRDQDQPAPPQPSSDQETPPQPPQPPSDEGDESDQGDQGQSDQGESDQGEGDQGEGDEEQSQAGSSGSEGDEGSEGADEDPDENDASKGISSSGDTDQVGSTSGDDGGSPLGESLQRSETLRKFENNVSEEVSYENKTNVPTLFPRASSVRKATNSYKKLIENRNLTSTYLTWKTDPDVINSYGLYKKTVKKKTGVLIREFERRKAAFRYSRSQEARSGSIDVNNLYKYRYDDQIFKTVTRIADGKNHGMIFYIDYSYSMIGVLKDVIDQTLNLVYFCRKMSIPYEVYSYTSGTKNTFEEFCDRNEIALNSVVINNIMSSSMSKSDFEIGFQQLYFQLDKLKGRGYYSTDVLSDMERLGGTPLNTVILAANHHCNAFQKMHKVDKLNVIILSDGDSQSSGTVESTSGITIFEGKKIDLYPKRDLSLISAADPRPSKFRYVRRDLQQECALKLLRKKANVIGMFLPPNRKDAAKKLNLAGDRDYERFTKQYSKESFVSIPECGGYDNLIILPVDVSIRDEEFNYSVDEDLTNDRAGQTRLARDFARVNLGNKKSRVILAKFAELIA